MATTAGGLPYVESSDLISGYPTVSQALAEELDTQLAAKAALAGATYTGTHDFSGATLAGVSAGLSLITPTSIAYSGGSASSSGGTTTFTGVSSISLNGVFSDTHANYRVLISFYASIATDLNWRYRAGGTDNTSSTYYYRVANLTSTYGTGSGSLSYTPVAAQSTTQTLVALDVGGTRTTGFKTFVSWSQYSAGSTSIYGVSSQDSASTIYDGFTIYGAAGTITGNIRVYGYEGA